MSATTGDRRDAEILICIHEKTQVSAELWKHLFAFMSVNAGVHSAEETRLCIHECKDGCPQGAQALFEYIKAVRIIGDTSF